MKDKYLYELSAEVGSVSLIVTALSYQLDNKKGDTLNEQSLRNALHGVAEHLDRISEDITEIDEKYNLTEREASA